MKKRKENSIFKNIIIMNMLIILFIITLLLLAIVYKYFTYNKQKDIQASIDVKDLYSKIEKNEDKKKEVNSNTKDWELLLVNKNNKIPGGYNQELQEVEIIHKVDKRIADSLNKMLDDARKQGLSPIICSSYRSKQKQKQLFDNKTKEYTDIGYSYEEAKKLASYWVAIPGTGEHETGLAVDIVSEDYQILDEEQEETDVQKWLMENSYKYGFILRYPTDKKEITMINYEPWHYRYVGIENATYIKEHDMCLEEYIDYLKQFEENEYKELV